MPQRVLVIPRIVKAWRQRQPPGMLLGVVTVAALIAAVNAFHTSAVFASLPDVSEYSQQRFRDGMKWLILGVITLAVASYRTWRRSRLERHRPA